MSSALLNIGTIGGLFGLLWLLLDTRSNGPGYLIFFGLIALITGGALS